MLFKPDRNNTGTGDGGAIRYAVSWVLWPALFLICTAVTAYGFSQDATYGKFLYFNGAYLFLILSLLWLERVMPHEKAWHVPDGQNFANIAHTLSSKGTSQLLLAVNTSIGVGVATNNASGLLGVHIWPSDWPLYGQIILAIFVSEFMLYWAHRMGHEFMPMWRFHAVHHSVKKLWIVNTGRFHFIDSLQSILMGIFPLVILGASMDVIMWLGAITAFIGMLTHCNVEMRTGFLSLVFNTPELHRWHHSKRLREGNKNYGENVMIWDQIFGTFFMENRRPPKNIGITDYMPDRFAHQLAYPFLTKKRRKEIADAAGFIPFQYKKPEQKPQKEDVPQAAE